MFKQTPVTATKNYHSDFLKVVVINRSPKGAMASTLFIVFY